MTNTTTKTLTEIASLRNATVSRVVSEILKPGGWRGMLCTKPSDRDGKWEVASAYRGRQMRQMRAGYTFAGPKAKLP